LLKGKVMKRAILGALLGAGLVAVAVGLCGRRSEVFAQHAAPNQPVVAGGELIAIPTADGDKAQLLTVIDPRQQAIGVYRVDLGSGRVTLLSVRNIQWDLQMTEFNGVNPLPGEIRSQLKPR
jgi:hypothetical protein